MSTTEKILAEMNECRRNPSKYSQKLSKIIKYYHGKIFARPGYEAIETEEGSGNVIACINYLKTIVPIEPLEWSQSLTLAAQMHADDIGPSGLMTHIGQDGSEPCDRIERFGQWSGHLGENIDYGNADPEDIVVSLLIDDGVLARGQRLNIMKREHKYAGVGFGYHSEYEYVCVILFAELVIENTIVTSPSLSSARKIRKSEYVKVKEITEEQSKIAASRKKSRAQNVDTISLNSKNSYTKPNFGATDFSDDEIIEIKEFFDKLDIQNSGMITVTEIKQLLEKKEPELSNSSMLQILANLDANAVGTLDFESFVSMMAGKIHNKKHFISPQPVSEITEHQVPLPIVHKRIFQMTQDIILELKEIFNRVDNENSGYADLESLKAELEKIKQESYNSTILEIVDSLNPQENSKISFEDLIEVISNINSLSEELERQQSSSVQVSRIKKPKIPRNQVNSYESFDVRIKKCEGFRKDGKGFDPSDYETSGISKDQIVEIKRAFDLFDFGKKGVINSEELKSAMEDQGFKHKNPTVFELFCQLDLEGKDEIDFTTFLNMLTERNETSSENEIKKFFDLFDREGLGYIEIKNLKNVVKDIGESLDDEDIVDLIRKSDLDGDGKVTYQDFYNIMSKAL
ncbi:hypothetical protein SteCoe_37102 [Stentor coeruleus]|uniref:EF-hand domain-containing protein n=1 Tax=Stentor coeruleus TaxID=5963 RepID=A0A1R2ANR6_9CILI|nr:hypothetical protein SteCoe_37102 [Stentor coeruleus]